MTIRRIFLVVLGVMATAIPAAAPSYASTIRPSFFPAGVHADFDGNRTDLEGIQESFLQIQRARGSGMEIAVADLDDDNDFDIIVQNRLLKQPATVWMNDGTGAFTESTLRTVSDTFGQRSWQKAARENESEDLVDVERIEWIVSVTSTDLPSRMSSRLGWHVLLTSNELSGHDETFHLRGPPTTFRA